MIDWLFELVINVIQSGLVTTFLMKCLRVRDESKKKSVFFIGFAITLLYLEVLNNITAFEGLGVFVYLFFSIEYSVIYLKATKLEKVFYNLVMMGAIVIASILGGSVVGIAVGKEYLYMVNVDASYRYAGVIMTQIILLVELIMILKIKRLIVTVDVKYMSIVCAVPIISIIASCLILYRDESKFKLYTILAVVCIAIINVISIVLLIIEHKTYEERLHQKLRISAYEQKERDEENVRLIRREISKYAHEMKRIQTVAIMQLEQGEVKKALEYLKKYVANEEFNYNVEEYTDNNILNYIVSRNIAKCSDKGIEFTYNLQEKISGIDELDIYIAWQFIR